MSQLPRIHKFGLKSSRNIFRKYFVQLSLRPPHCSSQDLLKFAMNVFKKVFVGCFSPPQSLAECTKNVPILGDSRKSPVIHLEHIQSETPTEAHPIIHEPLKTDQAPHNICNYPELDTVAVTNNESRRRASVESSQLKRQAKNSLKRVISYSTSRQYLNTSVDGTIGNGKTLRRWSSLMSPAYGYPSNHLSSLIPDRLFQINNSTASNTPPRIKKQRSTSMGRRVSPTEAYVQMVLSVIRPIIEEHKQRKARTSQCASMRVLPVHPSSRMLEVQ